MRIARETNEFILSGFRFPVRVLGEVDLNRRWFGQQPVVGRISIQPFFGSTLC